jgi:hypothetical protein
MSAKPLAKPRLLDPGTHAARALGTSAPRETAAWLTNWQCTASSTSRVGYRRNAELLHYVRVATLRTTGPVAFAANERFKGIVARLATEFVQRHRSINPREFN